MPPLTALNVFEIRFKVKHARSALSLSDPILRAQIQSFFSHYNAPVGPENRKRLVRVSSFITSPAQASRETSAFRVVRVERNVARGLYRGVIGYGEYGRPGEIVNVDADADTHNKSEREADLGRYYFLLYLPPGHMSGILICQKTSTSSPKRSLCLALSSWLKSDADDKKHILVRTGVLNQRAVVEQYLSESVAQSVSIKTVVKERDSRSAIGRMLLGGQRPEPGTSIELKLSRKRGLPGAVKSKVVQAMSGDAHSRDIVSLVGLNAGSHVSVVTTTSRGKRRTLNMSKLDETGLSYDITGEVSWRDGEATFTSVDQYALSLLEQFANALPAEGQ